MGALLLHWVTRRCTLSAGALLDMSNVTAPPFSVDLGFANSWPLYTVFPGSTLFFVLLYRAGPKFWPYLFARYKNMSPLNKKCWQRNTNALLHTLVLCPLLLVAMLMDDTMRVQRPLHPHHNTL